MVKTTPGSTKEGGGSFLHWIPPPVKRGQIKERATYNLGKKLVETSADISLFPGVEIAAISQKCLPPPPLTHCCLEGLRIHQGFFGGKATLIRGRGGVNCCSK